MFLPTCPNWAMARRVAICSDMDRVPSASRQKRGPMMVRLVLFRSLWPLGVRGATPFAGVDDSCSDFVSALHD
eukprot:scaffold3908_cov133-Isochrysis_galbana.AAC.1